MKNLPLMTIFNTI